MLSRGPKFLILVFLVCSAAFSVTRDPLKIAAQYYFSRHDYRQALKLWSQVLERDPQNVEAVERVGELSLMYSGRELSRKVVVDFLEKFRGKLDAKDVSRLEKRLGELQSRFLNDETQSLYLQAVAKVEHRDCKGAVVLLQKALEKESLNFSLLSQKAQCERLLGNIDAFYLTVKRAYRANPYDGKVLEWLSQVEVYNGNFREVVELFRQHPERLQTLNQKVAWIASKIQEGNAEEVYALLEGILSKEKDIPRELHYLAGVAYSKDAKYREKAEQELSTYLSLGSEKKPESSGDVWDPYSKLVTEESAETLLVSLKKV